MRAKFFQQGQKIFNSHKKNFFQNEFKKPIKFFQQIMYRSTPRLKPDLGSRFRSRCSSERLPDGSGPEERQAELLPKRRGWRWRRLTQFRRLRPDRSWESGRIQRIQRKGKNNFNSKMKSVREIILSLWTRGSKKTKNRKYDFVYLTY